MSSHPSIDRAAFREGMARVAASVHLVTTDGAAGRRGVTVTSVCSVSDSPATLLVCLNHSSPSNALFEENAVFAVNVLSPDAEGAARAFAGENRLDAEARFATARWGRLETGAPILDGALASFDCRIVDSRVVATHRVLIGEVVGLRLGEKGPSLLYRDRSYRTL